MKKGISNRWEKAWPGHPGWYWVYQELNNDLGTYCQPHLIESEKDIPFYAKAFYGPLQAPEITDNIKSKPYK